MAFVTKFGNLLKRSVRNHINSESVACHPSIYQAIRCMSSSKLFVGGLSYSIDDTSLRETFSDYGDIIEAKVIVDRETGRSRGFGFVTFTSSEEASAAINGLDGKDLHGRIVRVNHAIGRSGGYGGGGYGGGGYGGGGYRGGGSGGYGGGGSGGYGGGGSGGYGGGGSGGYGGGGAGGYGGGGAGGYGGGYGDDGRYGNQSYVNRSGGYGEGAVGSYNTANTNDGNQNFNSSHGDHNFTPSASGSGNFDTNGGATYSDNHHISESVNFVTQSSLEGEYKDEDVDGSSEDYPEKRS